MGNELFAYFIRWLLFHGDILIPFDLLLDRNHFYLFFRNNLLVVLYPLLHSIKVLLDNFPGNSLHNRSLLVLDDFALNWHFLNIGSVFVFNDLLFVGNVIHSALPCVR
jgi:hypothetical protein